MVALVLQACSSDPTADNAPALPDAAHLLVLDGVYHNDGHRAVFNARGLC
jgi:hypothetical protein